MKAFFVRTFLFALTLISFRTSAQTAKAETTKLPKGGASHLYIDVHQLEPGKVNYEAVAAAHAKDLAVQRKYGVQFIKFWVNEEKGLVYCLSSTADSSAIREAHAEAHGLLPEHIYLVTDGIEAPLNGNKNLYLDIHQFGEGKVSAKDVAGAHQKDLATEKKYGVNFINYWVDEKAGVVMCLSEAADSSAVIKTHKEAHGLIPEQVLRVKQGQ
jgi:hypothetical protein